MKRENIVKLLRSGTVASDEDNKAFKEYLTQKITLTECMKRFKENNRIEDEDFKEITEDEFEKFLLSLGWYLDEDEYIENGDIKRMKNGKGKN